MYAKFNSAKAWRVAIIVALLIAFAPAVATSGIKPDVMTNSVAGTTWEGPETTGGRTSWTFEEDGTLSYKTQNGSFRNGTWTQTGNAIYWETNKRYAQYVGEINGNTMEGRAWNRNMKWTWQTTKEE